MMHEIVKVERFTHERQRVEEKVVLNTFFAINLYPKKERNATVLIILRPLILQTKSEKSTVEFF